MLQREVVEELLGALHRVGRFDLQESHPGAGFPWGNFFKHVQHVDPVGYVLGEPEVKVPVISLSEFFFSCSRSTTNRACLTIFTYSGSV